MSTFVSRGLAGGIAALAALLLLAPGQSAAAGRPAFAQRYVGTVTGTFRGAGRIDTWTVSGIDFRLSNARFARGRWGGNYLVRAGRVSFVSRGTTECRFVAKGALDLGRLSWESASIDFLQDRSGSFTYVGSVSKLHGAHAQATCSGPDGSYSQPVELAPAGGAWLHTDIAERFVPGHRLSGSYTTSRHGGVATWRWNLIPR